MLIGAIVGMCILLALLAFLAPRLSSGPQRGVNKVLGSGQRAGGSASAGRRGRSKLPL